MTGMCTPHRYRWTGKIRKIIDYDGLGFPYEWQEKIYEPIPEDSEPPFFIPAPFDIIAETEKIVAMTWEKNRTVDNEQT